VEGDGLDLKLYLSLSDGIATRARVLRAVRVSVGDGHPIEAALELTRIMAVDQQKIAQFILAAELKKRRAALQLESDRMRSPISAVGSPSPLGADSNWPEPSDSDRDLASFVLTDFEDRRVLCAPDQLEIKDACVAGVIELRHFLTEMIGELAPASELAAQLRAIRAACRKFLDEFEPQADSGQFASRHRGDWALGTALGELRGVTGVWVAAIAETHGVVVGPSLAAILPATPSDRD
jgi:hypothetical protein